MTEQEFDNFLITTNKLGAKNLDELSVLERNFTKIRVKQLIDSPIVGNFDYEHLKKIHSFIFQDVYTWAGKDRNELGIGAIFAKGSTIFVPADKLNKYATEIFDELKENNYLRKCKDDENFFTIYAELFANLNALHPFREGNGRTQRIFLNQLANDAGYKLDLNLIPKESMIIASIDASRLNYDRIKRAFKANYDFLKEQSIPIRDDSMDAVLSRLGDAYTKKMQSGAIKLPQISKKSKEKER